MYLLFSVSYNAGDQTLVDMMFMYEILQIVLPNNPTICHPFQLTWKMDSAIQKLIIPAQEPAVFDKLLLSISSLELMPVISVHASFTFG